MAFGLDFFSGNKTVDDEGRLELSGMIACDVDLLDSGLFPGAQTRDKNFTLGFGAVVVEDTEMLEVVVGEAA